MTDGQPFCPTPKQRLSKKNILHKKRYPLSEEKIAPVP